jgi:hypothetical protein
MCCLQPLFMNLPSFSPLPLITIRSVSTYCRIATLLHWSQPATESLRKSRNHYRSWCINNTPSRYARDIQQPWGVASPQPAPPSPSSHVAHVGTICHGIPPLPYPVTSTVIAACAAGFD